MALHPILIEKGLMRIPHGNSTGQLRFKHPEELQIALENYFLSCWEPEFKENSKGEFIPLKDREGNPKMKQVRPYTMSGLAIGIGLSRRSLVEYRKKDMFSHILQRAKDFCENHIEEGMLMNKIPAIPAIFNLKNNYGWNDKTEVSLQTQITAMETIKKDGKNVEFDVGTPPAIESS